MNGKRRNGKGVSRTARKVRKAPRGPRSKRDHGSIHKTAEEMGYYRCVGCNGQFPALVSQGVGGEVPGKLLFRDRHLVLCTKCTGIWVWYPARKYIRMAVVQRRWLRQGVLTDTLVKIFGSAYVVSELKMIEWGVSSRGGFLSFDIAIPSLNLLIDYHGEQHFSFPNRWHKTRRAFTEQLRRDADKVGLASENGWRYLVIGYNEPVGNLDWIRMRLASVADESQEEVLDGEGSGE